MRRKAAPAALAAALLAVGAASCHDATRPPALSLQLAAASRLDSLDVSDTTVAAESAFVTIAGDGAATAQWMATHGSAPWLTLVRASGTGSGWVTWRRDASWIGYGVSVDTIAVSIARSLEASLVDSVVARQLPALVTERRAWLPGERDSLVARMERDSLDGFYVPAAVAQLLARTDSATVIVPNPALSAPARQARLGRFANLGQAGQTWIMVGYDLREVYPITPGSTTLDSLNLVGVLWYASPESTWKGRILAASVKGTYATQAVNTSTGPNSFDSTYETSGAGGGEARFSTGEYWEASSGQITIKSNRCVPTSCADASFTSGPWLGGVWHGIQVGGNLITIVAPCLLPSGCTSPPDTFSVSFTGTPVAGLAITCIFPTPCSGPAAARIARLARRAAGLEIPLAEMTVSSERGEVRGSSER